MSTGLTWQTNSPDSETTERLGQRLGKALKGGEVIELVSDLGGGKTTFVRGLAQGAGSLDKVASPTFTISKVYDCPRFKICHFDFYRLGDPGVVGNELAEAADDPELVTVVEWADIVKHVLPDKRLTIKFAQTMDGGRQLHFHYQKDLAYLMEALK